MKRKLCNFKESQCKAIEDWAIKYSEGQQNRAIREMVEYADAKKKQEIYEEPEMRGGDK